MTGNGDNILGISFSEKDEIESNDIEIVKWYFPKTDKNNIRTFKKELLDQVLLGLNSINEYLKINYKLSKIYYVPSEDSSGAIYWTLVKALITHSHETKEFLEITKSKNLKNY